jgi:excisionase family DNA binding protein
LRGWVTLPELAAARGVSRVAVHQAIRAGKLRAYRAPNGRTWLIHVEDARAYLARPRRPEVA